MSTNIVKSPTNEDDPTDLTSSTDPPSQQQLLDTTTANKLTRNDVMKIATQLGIIYTSFPENQCPEFEGQTVFPSTYYTLSSKEKLLLLFAENFRCQFSEKYPHRRPQILAIENECKIQVRVCDCLY